MTKKWGLLIVALLAGGVGALGWWSLQSSSTIRRDKKPARPLELRLSVKKLDPKTGAIADPLAAQLSVSLADQSPLAAGLLDERCVWQIESVRYRPNASASWQEVAPGKSAQTGPVELVPPVGTRSYNRTWVPNYSKAGEWKSVVSARVELETAQALWQGKVSHEFEEKLTQADLKRRAARRLAAKTERASRAIAEDSGGVKLVPGKRYIKKIQWSEDGGQTWSDAPATDKGALAVPQLTSLGLRAVKADPKTQWPDTPDFLPFWTFKGQKYLGDQVFIGLGAVSRNAGDLRVATAHCGQQVPVKIRVLPPGELVVYASREQVALPAKTGPIRVSARSNARSIPKGARIYFMAHYADGTRADLIGKPGFKDDIVALKGRTASATLRPIDRPATVTISARMGDKGNTLLAKSDVNATIGFVAPTPTPKTGQR